jgi:chitinase
MKKLIICLFAIITLSSIGFAAGNTKKVNATYWCVWGGNTSYSVEGKQIKSKAIDMNKISSAYNVIITAFIVNDKSGNFSLAFKDPGDPKSKAIYTPAQIQDFIKNVKAKGIKPIVSVGGEKFSYAIKTEADKKNFEEKIKQIIDFYRFEGLDIDFELEALNSDADLVGQAVLDIANHYRAQGIDFWLTAAPEWTRITPAVYGGPTFDTSNEKFYIPFFKAVGMNNITYIWPQTYNQGPSNGVVGSDGKITVPTSNTSWKNPSKEYGMDKFLNALTWALSTKEGYAANGSKGIIIPVKKLVLGIPATEGAAGGNMSYIATPDLISSAYKLMKKNNVVAAGFMNWSVDWDALRINNRELSEGYTHAPWETGKAVASAMNLHV